MLSRAKELTSVTVGGNRINAFAFVEFARPDLAERAIESMVRAHTSSSNWSVTLTQNFCRTTSPWAAARSVLSASLAVIDRAPAPCALKLHLEARTALAQMMSVFPRRLFDVSIITRPPKLVAPLDPARTPCLVTCRRMPTFLPPLAPLVSWVLTMLATRLRRCIIRVPPS